MKNLHRLYKASILLSILLLSVFLLSSIQVQAQEPEIETTKITSQNFEQALIDLGIDSDGDINHSVRTSDISGVKYLDVSDRNISSLIGNIRYFYI